MIDDTLRLKLRKEATSLEPVAWIGKKGITKEVKLEIEKQLNDKHLIKVKVLRGFLEENELDKKTVAKELAADLKADLIQQVGFAIVLFKRGKARSDSSRTETTSSQKTSNPRQFDRHAPSVSKRSFRNTRRTTSNNFDDDFD
jgi:putative YhbY family RNA-binding protein